MHVLNQNAHPHGYSLVQPKRKPLKPDFAGFGVENLRYLYGKPTNINSPNMCNCVILNNSLLTPARHWGLSLSQTNFLSLRRKFDQSSKHTNTGYLYEVEAASMIWGL